MNEAYFVHPLADVQSQEIGCGTKVWQFCIIFKGAKIGSNCTLSAMVLVEADVIVGNNVTIKSGVQIWDGVRLENNVFIGPNVTFTNDIYPRSKVYPDFFQKTIVKAGASIGANSTILPGLEIGENALVGAGSVVVKNVLPNSLVMGNPAKFVKFL